MLVNSVFPNFSWGNPLQGMFHPLIALNMSVCLWL
jgi:hypothetical protein